MDLDRCRVLDKDAGVRASITRRDTNKVLGLGLHAGTKFRHGRFKFADAIAEL